MLASYGSEKTTGFDSSFRHQTDIRVPMSTFVVWQGLPTCYWNLLHDGYAWMNYTNKDNYPTSQRPALFVSKHHNMYYDIVYYTEELSMIPRLSFLFRAYQHNPRRHKANWPILCCQIIQGQHHLIKIKIRFQK